MAERSSRKHGAFLPNRGCFRSATSSSIFEGKRLRVRQERWKPSSLERPWNSTRPGVRRLRFACTMHEHDARSRTDCPHRRGRGAAAQISPTPAKQRRTEKRFASVSRSNTRSLTLLHARVTEHATWGGTAQPVRSPPRQRDSKPRDRTSPRARRLDLRNHRGFKPFVALGVRQRTRYRVSP